ncbi:lipoprotein insertase outer membrane protein LolB [Marilutibacter alkalisoli]|uniref:Outer-membrane lipoprotein LolB n=1 Tax=Marilutibacter alkalisoli TaxID=2591633 RepID=A0A514BTH8_9GAMM|nr:lipoprotein insertase outer membrane protein LolB [Lysobacter alkalisoli]QDH70711.1 outer membrane lipoprotein LolB [Lysobacter alkalisoli]
MSLRFLAVAACAVLLVACTSRPVRSPLPPELLAAAEARQLAREQALRAQPDWGLQGRIAMSVDRNGGSGRVDWRQDGHAFTVELSAPVTRQGWRLSGGPGWAQLDGLDDGPRSGADASELLYDATGWLIPVEALGDWVRGLRAQAAGPAEVEYGADGRLQRLSQGGWQIDYSWPPVEAGGGMEADRGASVLPRRIDARREAVSGPQARVRLVVDHWNLSMEASAGAASR